jgi:LacI family transcriptional regulator
MKYEPITIKDIAQALGLSISTVSRALRDSYEISQETKQLVMDYAAKMHYRPNPIALSLKERRTRSLGIVVSEIANSFFSQAINGIESIAREKGYTVIITQTAENKDREIENIHDLASRSVDGLLVSLSCETTDIGYLKTLHDRGMPMVFFDRVPEEINTHKVISDNYNGAYDATNHLLDSGYQRIAFLGNAAHLSIIKERLAGYTDAHRHRKLPVDEALIKYAAHGGLIYAEAEDALNQLLKLRKKPDAVLACADKLTTNCLRYFHARSIRVPDEIALVGFSNLDLTELLKPSLSVIRQPAFEIGQQATELLLQILESKRPVRTFEQRSLPSQLIIRETSDRQKPVAKKATAKR